MDPLSQQTGVKLLQLGVRFYEPSTGRFTQRDPVDRRSVSRYAYVQNAPIQRVDPSGMLDINCPNLPNATRWAIKAAVDNICQNVALLKRCMPQASVDKIQALCARGHIVCDGPLCGPDDCAYTIPPPGPGSDPDTIWLCPFAQNNGPRQCDVGEPDIPGTWVRLILHEMFHLAYNPEEDNCQRSVTRCARQVLPF